MRRGERAYSVVIPLYNKGAFVKRALQSVLKQTYADFEIVVIDDGSTDDGPSKVAALADSRVRLYRQPNSGVALARNAGVLRARYEYVVFLDADDTWEPAFLSTLNTLIDTFPDAGIFGINHWFRLDDGRLVVDTYRKMFEGRDMGLISDYFGLFARLGRSPFSNSGCAFPKQLFLQEGGYKANVRLTEDSDLWCRLALNHKVAFATTPLVTYYVETVGNTRSAFDAQDFQVSRTLQEALDGNVVPEERKRSIRRLVALQQLRLIKRALLADDKAFARRKLTEKRFVAAYPLRAIFYMFASLFPANTIARIHGRLKRRY